MFTNSTVNTLIAILVNSEQPRLCSKYCK